MAAKPKGSAEVDKKSNALEKLVVEYVPVGDLKPNDYNPNRQSDHDFELLLRSMREDGFTQPVVALKATKIIVDGEHRWRAGQALGYTEIPVVYVDMTPEQARIATLRHNRARGSEDVELAASVLRDLVQLGATEWAQESLMLSDEEMERLLEDIPAPEALASDEFSQAWIPSDVDDETGATDDISEAPQTVSSVVTAAPGGGTQMQAMSVQAIEAARERERQLALAKTAEERQKIQQEAQQFFRLMLLFQGEEAVLVRGVLGDQAAEKLLNIINHWLESHPEDKPAAE